MKLKMIDYDLDSPKKGWVDMTFEDDKDIIYHIQFKLVPCEECNKPEPIDLNT